MRPVLFDTDAFHCARNLGLISLFRGAWSQEAAWRFLMTEYIARQELNLIRQEIEVLVACGILAIYRVLVRSHPAYGYFEALHNRGRGRAGKQGVHVDKGEAEAIAWAMSLPPAERPLFISNDRAALRCASNNEVPAGDLMDLIVEAVTSEVLARDDVKQAVSVWDDKRQERCRPRDYEGFDETFQRRCSTRGNAS